MTTKTKAQTAAERDDRIRSNIRERDHLEDCPGIAGDGRVEAFDAPQPSDANTGRPPRKVLVCRCLECGGHRVRETMTMRDILRPSD